MAARRRRREDRFEPEPPGLELLPLMNFAGAVDEDLDEPWHLWPFVDAWQRIESEPVRVCMTTGRQHGKSTLARLAIAWLLLRRPRLHIALVSNAAHLSQLHSMAIKTYFQRCGGRMGGDLDTRSHWMTAAGGSLLATGVEGQGVGHRFDVIVADDLYKNRAEAECSLTRDHVDQWFKAALQPTLWPGGSIIVVSSRWTIDDQTGRLLQRGWGELALPVIDSEGRALWPERKPLEYLATLRDPRSPDYVEDYEWNSQYLCKPGTQEGAPFRGCTFYRDAPGYLRIAIGVDLAFSTASRSDWTAIVVLGYEESSAHAFVLEVRRVRHSITGVRRVLAEVLAAYPGAEAVSYYSGTEKGSIDMLLEDGIRITPIPARGSKLQRATRCAEAWSSGRVHVLEGAPWAGVFVSEVCGFTGSDRDSKDDQVDALVSAYDMLASYASSALPMAVGHRCM